MNDFIGCCKKRAKTCSNTDSLLDTEFVRRSRIPKLTLLLFLLFLAGCASQSDVYQPRHGQSAGEIWGDQTLGQTFVADANGLHRIDVLLATYARENAGPVIFHLRTGPTATQDLTTVRFDAADVADNAYRSFSFAPLANSANQSYYFFLEAPAAEPGNAITVWASPTDTYPDGQSYLAGQPQAGDLAFNTYTEYGIAEIGRDLWRGVSRHAGTTVLAILLFLLPGLVVLTLVGWGSGTRYWGLGIEDWERVVVAAGLSVALAPLLSLFTSSIGLHLSRSFVSILLTLTAIVALLLSALRRFFALFMPLPFPPAPQYPSTPAPQHPSPSAPSGSPGPSAPSLVLTITFIISLATRLLLVRDLPAPMWGDSYHHTLIAQLLADHGGLFQSWEPYAPLQSFTYHFGFHSNVTLFHWLTGMPILESVIVVGQILNALAPLMIYPLVRRLGGSQWAGVIAVLIASLLSPMPARYVNWGRYTQLTGMTVLPVATTLTIDAVSGAEWRWRRIALASIAVAGLFLSHYLVTMLFAPFVLGYLVWWIGIRMQQRNQVLTQTRERSTQNQDHTRRIAFEQPRTWFLLSEVKGAWLQAGTIAVIAGALLTPWLVNLWHGTLPRALVGRFGRSSQAVYFQTEYNVLGDALTYVPAWLIAAAAVGIVWGLWRRKPVSVVTTIWTALLILLVNPNIIALPGAGVINNFLLLIALYLPLSILAGVAVGDLIDWATNRFPRAQWAVAGLVIVAALAGARFRLMDLDYRYQLVKQTDRDAMAWIRENTPANAKFLINSFATFAGHTVVGEDAGWWIPYLAGRQTTVPPATYGLEVPPEPDYVAQVEAFYREIAAQPLDNPETAQMLRANGVTHLYIGAVGGELLQPTTLLESPFYNLVYDQGGVMIFEVAQH